MNNNSVCNGCKYYEVCGDDSRAVACDGFAVPMETIEQITKKIEKNIAMIDRFTNDIESLSMAKEIKSALFSGDVETAHKIRTQKENNAGKIAALCGKVYLLKVENMVLNDNRRARIVSDFIPLLLEACKPFNGKPYGEKTRKKISKCLREKGFSFYFDGYTSRDSLQVAKLNDKGGACGSDFIRIYGRYDAPFVTSDNKLNVCAENTSDFAVIKKYTANTKAAAKRIIKTYNKYQLAVENANKAQTELNAILPAGIDHFSKVSRVYPTIL